MFWIVVLTVVGIYYAFILFSNRYVNLFDIEMYFAPPGVGKTVFLNKLAYKYRKSWHIYSTSNDVTGEYIDPSSLGKFVFSRKENNLLLIDESSILFNNRNYKTFGDDLRRFFKLHRHMHLKIIMASQDFEDVDKTIRKLTTRYYMLDRFCGLWVRARRIRKILTLTTAQGSEAGTITDSYEYMPLLSRGSRQYAFLPKWVGKTDSFNIDMLGGLPELSDYRKRGG